MNASSWHYGKHLGGHGLGYHLYVPPLLHRQRARVGRRPLPLVLWLHGGTWTTFDSHDDNELVNGSIFASAQRVMPHFLLRPIARRRESWVRVGPHTGSHPLTAKPPPSLGLASKLLDDVLNDPAHRAYIDRERLVVAGASMGGYGVWELIQRRPHLFHAAIPICGGGDIERAWLLNATRIWAFHSADDPLVPVNASREMIRATLAARHGAEHRGTWSTRKRYSYVDTPQGMRQKLEAVDTISRKADERQNRRFADLRYTEYVGGGHDAWTRALNTAGLARWALRATSPNDESRREIDVGERNLS